MSRTIPSSTSTRTIPAPEAGGGGGGGGGGGNPYVSWVDLELDPTNDYWVMEKTGNSNNEDVICDLHNGQLRAQFGTQRNYQIQSDNTNNGISIIKKTHINWWDAAGIAKPSNRDAHIFEPEAIQFKLEVEFDCTNGPIHGGSVSGANGQNLMVVAGFAMYTSDQSGSPTPPGTSACSWGGALLRKNMGGDPTGSTSINMYRSGHKTFATNATDTNGALWKGQSTAGNGANDSLIFASGPIRNETATGTWSRCVCFAGGYSKTDPFGRVWQNNFGFRDNFTKWSNGFYIHPAIFIGTNTSVGRGEIQIKKIRMLIQPLENREDLE
tara:strand:+ start:840 stop:1814 length:975 start_codon:yes stop_codon:yes gene_type:complete